MPYFTDLFTIETYEAFLGSDGTVSGFRENQGGMTKRIKRGDRATDRALPDGPRMPEEEEACLPGTSFPRKGATVYILYPYEEVLR